MIIKYVCVVQLDCLLFKLYTFTPVNGRMTDSN